MTQNKKLMEAHKANIEWMRYNEKLSKLNLEVGLKARYDKDVHDQEQELKHIQNEIKITEEAIRQLEDEQ